MSQRSYDQNCGLALTLDVLGERWTLLVVRELSLGPKRFGDLADRLPGIGTNLLAARLKSLEAHGVAERTVLPAPANVAAYRLTARGEALRPMLEGLALWGFELLGEEARGQRHTRASWMAMTMRAVYARDPDRRLRLLANLRVEDEELLIDVDGAACKVTLAASPHAVLDAGTDLATFIALAEGARTPSEATAAGDLEVAGDVKLLDRLFARFRFPATPSGDGSRLEPVA